MTSSNSSNNATDTPIRKAKPTKKQLLEAIEKSKSKAEEYAQDPKKAKRLLDDAVKKSKSYEKNRGPLAEVWSYLTALIRLLKSYIRKEYRDIPGGSIVLVIVAIIYFVSPIDLIPDWLPGGFIDEAAVIAIVIKQIRVDLDNFLAWEIAQSHNESSM